jgi:glycosyltransferase 2 family protein
MRAMSIPSDRSARSVWASRRWLLLATAAIYVLTGVVIFRNLDRGTLERALSIPWALLAGLLGLSLLNYAIRAWRWIVLSGFLGFKIAAARNVLYYFAGYALTATPGKAGEAVRLWLMNAGHGIPYVRSIPIMLADRVIDTWAVLILTLLCFADVSRHLWQGIAVTVLVVLLSLPILFPLRSVPLLALAMKWWPRQRRSWAKARRLLRSMAELSHWRTYGVTLLPSVVGWAAEGFALYLLLRHFDAPVGVMQAVFVFCFSMIVGAISMMPGGLGSTEVTAVVLLKGMGVPLDVAVASTALVRVTTFWFAAAIGVALLPLAIGAATRSGARWSASNPAGAP